MPEDFIEHYGVPGMRWGQRCNTAWPRNADWEASVAAARAHNERGEG